MINFTRINLDVNGNPRYVCHYSDLLKDGESGYGTAIAYKYNDPKNTLSITNCGWFTNTTKERLNSIDSVNVYQRKGQWFLNDKEWDGELIDVN